MGGRRALELNIRSGKGLKRDSSIRHMHCYAIAWIDPRFKYHTKVDEDGGCDPVWNQNFIIWVKKSVIRDASRCIIVEIYNRGPLHHSLIGTARIPLSDLPENARLYGEATEPKFASFQVYRPSGKAHGMVEVTFRLQEAPAYSSSSSCSDDESPYPAGAPIRPDFEPIPSGYAQPYSSGSNPYTPNYGYGEKPPGYPNYGYAGKSPGYPSGAPGYGYGLDPYGSSSLCQPPNKHSGHTALAVGVGLAAGALGGLVLGEVVDEIIDHKVDEAVTEEFYDQDQDF